MSIPQLPEKGQSRKQLLATMERFRADDADWRSGRTFSMVFNPGPAAYKVAKDAYNLFMAENALNPSAFPSLRRMEQECVGMTAHLLNADEDAAGSLSSGGTESIMLAVKTARDWARRTQDIESPEMVAPITAHPAFDKACHYFGVKMHHTPVGEDYRADVDAMREAINENTILLVGSAPQYAQGVVDPIEDIAALAAEQDILCHVDACIGGFLLPFVEALGHTVPAWDFRVEGVTSISCDLHKFAYTPKGASVILYRNKKLRRHQFHVYTDWPGGIYASPTMAGTRPGGAIAAAWAMLNYQGYAGYMEMAQETMQATQKILDGVRDIDGIEVLGSPHMSIAAIAGKGANSYAIGDEMQARGWHIDRQQFPASLHLTISRGHCGVEDEFLQDLQEAVEISRKQVVRRAVETATVKLTSGAAYVLPDKLFGAMTRAAAKLGTDAVPKRSAAMYGMMAELPARGELQELVLDALDRLNSLPEDGEKGSEAAED